MTETPEQAASRIARGPSPSSFIGGGGADTPPSAETTPFDPLRLCIFATVAALGWLFGPLAVLVFAGVGFAGYWKARKAGLTRSKCYLRDTRLVLAYLFALAVAGAVGLGLRIQEWLF
ncbi:MAG TPA: hypothetical protein PKV13_14585 [Propionicimonas sp.]|nr:hypothetical protein [Propionicimonas sp.]HRA07818.1 hypothetical protein [Propionicimonas sp.]